MTVINQYGDATLTRRYLNFKSQDCAKNDITDLASVVTFETVWRFILVNCHYSQKYDLKL